MKNHLIAHITILLLLSLSLGCRDNNTTNNESKDSLPNIVLIVADDMGYADVGVYGAQGFTTQNLDKLASQGTRFTSFYVSQAVCTASRASLMTGCYANRIGIKGAFNPTSTTGINQDEKLMPEVLKEKGYTNGIFGKWHLGNQSKFNPINHGFDTFYGLPYSNDNHNKYHPVIRSFPPLPVLEGDSVVELDPDQSLFTQKFTSRAVDFINENKDNPFFLYVPHVMPHVPIFASENFQGKTQRGLYGDVVEEIDWSVGEIMKALKVNGLENNTLVIFFSDNGPFLSYGEHAGSAGKLREGKLTTFEGGIRVPCIMKWPEKIPSNRTNAELITTMDLLPTITKLVDGDLSDNKIDGKDVWPILSGEEGAVSPHKAFFYYASDELHAVRSGQWKLHFPHQYLKVDGEPGKNGKPANFENLSPSAITESGLRGIASRHGYLVDSIGLELFNLKEDVGETLNVADDNPEVVKRLTELAEGIRKDLGDARLGQVGANIRAIGTLD